MSLLEEALEGWAYTRQGVIDELRNLPAKSMDFRPAPESRSAAELALHIVESGLLMVGELSRPDGNFRRQSYDAFLKEYAGKMPRPRDKDPLVALLRRTQGEGAKKLRQAGELQMLQFITQFNGQPATRLSWMQHGIAHEEYHRGQLALYARLLGKVPALTRAIIGS